MSELSPREEFERALGEGRRPNEACLRAIRNALQVDPPAQAQPQTDYDFKAEATRVCEAIGSSNGNMTMQCALREAYAAGAKSAALSALPVRPQTDGWQPIATAPKDGTEVLLFDDRRVVGAWGDRANGSLNWNDSEYTFNPSHWMPLPPFSGVKEPKA